MSRKRRSRTLFAAVLSCAAIAAAVAYAVLDSMGSEGALEYFKDVHQVVSEPQRWRGRRLRVHGNVVAGTIQKKTNSMEYRFAVFSRDKWIEVTYKGLVPDTFKDCAEVVVKGKLDGARAFRATEVTAKCPSKYDEKQRLSGCGEHHKPKVLASRSL